MALINCPECNRQISNSAASCPQCGHPIQGAKNVYVTNAKKGKGKKLIGGILIFLSIIMAFGNSGQEAIPIVNGFIGLMFIGGIGLSIYGKIEHWWHWK